MFKNNNDNTKSRMGNLNSPERLNRIVEGTSIEGSISSESNIRIDGEVKGTITTKGRLVVGVSGVIKGDVVCQNAEIEGHVKGSMKVGELLSLKSTAKVEGDVITGKLAIEPGAIFAVTCSMGGVSPSKKSIENKERKEEEVVA
jgi:cytoskeletal protein CcmA (bactofilin family)